MTKDLSLNFTGIGSKVFKITERDFYRFKDRRKGVRGFIDSSFAEFDMTLAHISDPADKAWYKLLKLLSIFEDNNDLETFQDDVKQDIARKISCYPDYEIRAKLSFASFILLLRTGEYAIVLPSEMPFERNEFSRHFELADSMSIDALIYLLKEELSLRAKKYNNEENRTVLVEIEDLHYDYDELCRKYSGDEYIEYITTVKHTQALKSRQRMIAEMNGEY